MGYPLELVSFDVLYLVEIMQDHDVIYFLYIMHDHHHSTIHVYLFFLSMLFVGWLFKELLSLYVYLFYPIKLSESLLGDCWLLVSLCIYIKNFRKFLLIYIYKVKLFDIEFIKENIYLVGKNQKYTIAKKMK